MGFDSTLEYWLDLDDYCFGGGRQGGISPSRKSPNIMIFSDQVVGREHGYADRKQGDLFLYVGEGQHGNQSMSHGNKAILNHVEDGRAIRLFTGCRGEVVYSGEFEIDHIDPFFTEKAPSSGGGQEPDVIVFRLHEVQANALNVGSTADFRDNPGTTHS